MKAFSVPKMAQRFKPLFHTCAQRVSLSKQNALETAGQCHGQPCFPKQIKRLHDLAQALRFMPDFTR